MFPDHERTFVLAMQYLTAGEQAVGGTLLQALSTEIAETGVSGVAVGCCRPYTLSWSIGHTPARARKAPRSSRG